jgi:hypothetical protein
VITLARPGGAPARTPGGMLRDLTEAVCAVAGRMLGLPDEEDPR